MQRKPKRSNWRETEAYIFSDLSLASLQCEGVLSELVYQSENRNKTIHCDHKDERYGVLLLSTVTSLQT